jgi:4-hydroxybenzoyl-CoA reductase subunit beta
MMRLPPFQFHAPRTLTEATRLMAEAEGAMVVAGGTDLFPNMKRLQNSPPALIGLGGIGELKMVERGADGGLALGAGLTLTEVEHEPLVRALFPSLAEAIPLVSTPPLRNMGTLGGNLCLDTRCHFINQTAFWRKAVGSCLKDVGEVCRVAPGSARCWAIASADLPPLLIALDARVELVSARGAREIPLNELYRDDGIDYLAKGRDEIVTRVILPRGQGVRAGYVKLRRRGAFDFPALGVAAAVRVGSGGECEAARVVLGAVTSKPLDMPQAQQLVGARVAGELISAVAEAMALQARPLQLADYTHSYRKQMIAVYTTRLLSRLLN